MLHLKIWPGDIDLWPWKSIVFQILLRTKYVPSVVKIHWRMLILECSQGCYMVKYLPSDFDLWPMTLKSIGFQTLLRTKYVPSLVKIHWRMLILECSQGCYALKIWSGDLDLWPWKAIGFQILLRTKYVPRMVKIHWRMLILECSQGCDGRTVALLYSFATSLARDNKSYIFWQCTYIVYFPPTVKYRL